MIVSGLSEEKILEELQFDRKIVANEAKKIAKKFIACQLKAGRDGIDADYDSYYTLTTSKLNNKWYYVVVVNMKKKPYWTHYAACMAESIHGTKDYYLLRGLSNNKPYFIKVSSHALKRFVERGFGERLHVEVNFSGGDCAPLLFKKGEIITWMKIADPKFLEIVLDSEDKNVITSLFYTHVGCYLGYETEHGNYEFRTFLNNDKKLKKLNETEVMHLCYLAHISLNPSLYTKDIVEKLKNDNDFHDIADWFDFKLMP